MADGKTINRSSISGKFVTPQYAKQHPKTTERQHVPVKSPKK